MKTFDSDREYLENKYHKVSEPFNPYNRMAYHGYEFDESTGLSDEEIKSGLRELEHKISRLPHPTAKTHAVRYVLQNTRIDINEHDYFVGFYSLARLIGDTTVLKWQSEIFDNELSHIRDEMKNLINAGAVDMWADFDHVVPDWDSLFKLGFPGIKKRADDYRKLHEQNGTSNEKMKTYFEAIDLEYTSILEVIDRLYKYSLTKTHAKAKQISECLYDLKIGAPKNTYEALQLIYIYFIISESFDFYQVRSLGNGLDRSLYPFYKNDIESGAFTREEIKEFIAYFLMQWSALGNYWGQPFYLGGSTPDGKTRVNDLSYDIIDVYDKLGIYNPKIQIKTDENIPEDFLYKIFDMIRRGRSSFVFCCMNGMIKAVMGYGATYDEAIDMDIRGCYETGVRANEVSTASAYINAPKAIEYVFSDGFDKRTGKDIGIKIGNVESLDTFEKFYTAVLAQWQHLIERSIYITREFEKYLGDINPSSMYSATIETSLEKGTDAYQNGVKFNNTSLLCCGFASLVDSVCTVKYLVFDTHKTDLTTFKKALDADWEGYGKLRKLALDCPHKYGNDDTEADTVAEAMARYFAMSVNNRKNARGGVYKSIMHSAMMFIWQGQKTAATPDGRKAGSEVSKNASPSAGMDKNGVTALINSAVKLHPYNFHESFCVDTMLDPSAVSGDDGLFAMKALLFTYLRKDGMSIQFNVFNSETLKDAQKHPEKYKNLQVRVCGWNVLWNNLSKAEQDAYIKRAECSGKSL